MGGRTRLSHLGVETLRGYRGLFRPFPPRDYWRTKLSSRLLSVCVDLPDRPCPEFSPFCDHSADLMISGTHKEIHGRRPLRLRRKILRNLDRQLPRGRWKVARLDCCPPENSRDAAAHRGSAGRLVGRQAPLKTRPRRKVLEDPVLREDRLAILFARPPPE